MENFPGYKSFFEWIKYLQLCLYGNIIKQGWLYKLGNVNKSWKRGYFVLNKYQQLKYYEDSERVKYLKMVDCKEILSVDNGKKSYDDHPYIMELTTKQRVWIIAAECDNDRVNF